jgi:hypothetical protein
MKEGPSDNAWRAGSGAGTNLVVETYPKVTRIDLARRINIVTN